MTCNFQLISSMTQEESMSQKLIEKDDENEGSMYIYIISCTFTHTYTDMKKELLSLRQQLTEKDKQLQQQQLMLNSSSSGMVFAGLSYSVYLSL